MFALLQLTSGQQGKPEETTEKRTTGLTRYLWTGRAFLGHQGIAWTNLNLTGPRHLDLPLRSKGLKRKEKAAVTGYLQTVRSTGSRIKSVWVALCHPSQSILASFAAPSLNGHIENMAPSRRKNLESIQTRTGDSFKSIFVFGFTSVMSAPRMWKKCRCPNFAVVTKQQGQQGRQQHVARCCKELSLDSKLERPIGSFYLFIPSHGATLPASVVGFDSFDLQ